MGTIHDEIEARARELIMPEVNEKLTQAKAHVWTQIKSEAAAGVGQAESAVDLAKARLTDVESYEASLQAVDQAEGEAV